MKIVILDTCTITNGDVSLQEIETAGQTSYYDILSKEEIINVSKEADAIICNKANIDEEIMSRCLNLKYVGVFATGYNNIDLLAASRHGISVANVPGYSTDSVAMLAFAMILEFATSFSRYNESVHNGDWVRSRQFSYFSYPISELAGKTLGIYGFGNIGRKMAEIGRAFGMNIIAYSKSRKTSDFVRFVSEEEIFSLPDYLSLHCPLTSETANLVNANTLSQMKSSAFLINTCRGGVITEEDLVNALNNGIIAGAGIDVLETEPMKENHPYLAAKNCLITPHIGWAAIESRERLIALVAENVKSFFAGNPINIVN
ncbi:D-2-hydroxyacid dehydrogenase [Parasporobacterium paucivorans]|uniref:Glycerate dehydrogenase n=1 Tax=Parasporobacterium paucivorans DSM 15970 TaxID=1122934 RepID=A0A1M6FSE1_9FIRM|nr:D-2-hydroxyacid dehydrogenase [Parasporobacterium paucivorans]SHJ00583.1 glycerate dehydrogenase [Parasporobacterium paucivorans DSM 15970]